MAKSLNSHRAVPEEDSIELLSTQPQTNYANDSDDDDSDSDDQQSTFAKRSQQTANNDNENDPSYFDGDEFHTHSSLYPSFPSEVKAIATQYKAIILGSFIGSLVILSCLLLLLSDGKSEHAASGVSALSRMKDSYKAARPNFEQQRYVPTEIEQSKWRRVLQNAVSTITLPDEETIEFRVLGKGHPEHGSKALPSRFYRGVSFGVSCYDVVPLMKGDIDSSADASECLPNLLTNIMDQEALTVTPSSVHPWELKTGDASTTPILKGYLLEYSFEHLQNLYILPKTSIRQHDASNDGGQQPVVEIPINPRTGVPYRTEPKGTTLISPHIPLDVSIVEESVLKLARAGGSSAGQQQLTVMRILPHAFGHTGNPLDYEEGESVHIGINVLMKILTVRSGLRGIESSGVVWEVENGA
jgi:hypothetical protein